MIAPELRPDTGPPAPPAAAGGVGLRSAECLRYRVDGRSAPVRIPVPFTPGDRPVSDGDELVWELFPAFDERAKDVRDGFRAASVALDLVFDDGTRLLEAEPLERDGTSSAAASRGDLDFPDQWNQRRLALGGFAGRRIVAGELVVAPPPRARAGGALVGWIDGIRIEPAAPLAASGEPVENVSTTRGSHSSPRRSRGLTQPATAVPHGGIQLAPATSLEGPHWTYSWNAHGPGPHPVLQGMLISRSPSIWIGDRGALAVRIGLDGDGPPATAFDHERERAQPHRYRLDTLDGIGIDASATDQAALIEVAFPAPGRLLLCAPGAPLEVTAVDTVTAGEVTVRATSTLPNPHERDPLRAYHVVTVRALGADSTALRVEHRPDALAISAGAGAVSIAVGTSQISSALAARASGAVASTNVDTLARAARDRWSAYLRTVEVDGTDEQRALVASDLYRLFLFPSRHDEDTPDGPRYPSTTRRSAPDGPDETGRDVRAGRMLTNNGFWDTYRTAWPAYALLAPARAGELLDGMLEHVREAGWSPRWTAGTPLDAMVGTSLDVVAADLVSAGVPGIDLRTAYDAALRNATADSADPRFGRRELTPSLARGWVSAATAESVSWTMEGAIADAGAAVLARELARTRPDEVDARQAEARYLAHRALAYRTLWDERTRFFRPRTARGRWGDRPFDPRRWGGGHTESNAWGQRFSAPHDGAGLARLYGGPRGLGEALDASFAEPETGRARFAGTYRSVIHEMLEARDIRRGMWAVSNQPAHHVPWMYAHTDRPWRAGEVLGDAVARLFRGIRIGQGYPGDEDNGEMSAWHLFALLGLAPYQPGSGMLLLTVPQVAEATLRPIGGETLVIRAPRRDAGDRFNRAVRRDGATWTRPDVPLSELRAGGVWEFELGTEPVAWAERPSPRPFFAPDGVDALALRDLAVRAAPLGALEAGSVRTLQTAPTPPSSDDPLLVIGLKDAGRHAFRVIADGRVIAQFRGEHWRWPQQTRPFAVPVPGGTRSVDLEWLGEPATLTLLQLLGP